MKVSDDGEGQKKDPAAKNGDEGVPLEDVKDTGQTRAPVSEHVSLLWFRATSQLQGSRRRGEKKEKRSHTERREREVRMKRRRRKKTRMDHWRRWTGTSRWLKR